MSLPAPGQLPLWALRLIAFALPVWGAWVGQLTVFQVIWVYWLEGWIVLPFLFLRIATARGPYAGGWTDNPPPDAPPATAGQRASMMLGLLLVRGGLLLFYLIFIIVFLLLQVSSDAAIFEGINTVRFGNSWANSAWGAFILAQVMEVATHFFSNGIWRTAPPARYAQPFDARTILLHIAIISTTMLHQFVFTGRDYAAKGEVAYVALFGLLRLAVDAVAARFTGEKAAAPVVDA